MSGVIIACGVALFLCVCWKAYLDAKEADRQEALKGQGAPHRRLTARHNESQANWPWES